MSERDEADPYLVWKGWGTDFAKLKPGDVQYYDSELRDVINLRGDLRVLEVGFGNGAFLAYCASRSWTVTGTELLADLVAIAREAGFDAHHAADLGALPDAAFDLIVAFDVFEHIPPSESVGFLRSLATKLAPGGRIVLRFPNVDTWIGNPLQHGDVTHVNDIGVLKMEYYAREAALELARVRGVRRRGFSTSIIHGLHKYTAGVAIKIYAGVAKALFFPDLRVVLSTSSVVCVLRRRSPV
ncbi:class I SAM-dependent methyltransferase [Agromyces sp. G08B096]|uniref:Class I SAM-dependent methyltransferase n=1 Tax=Agromyces sp. G08B096 TaxID=3156399 RepID=A0AAU7W5L7_9MICO